MGSLKGNFNQSPSFHMHTTSYSLCKDQVAKLGSEKQDKGPTTGQSQHNTEIRWPIDTAALQRLVLKEL